MDLGHGMIQNPAAEVAEVIEYLVTCEKTLASLYTLADCLISWQARSYENTCSGFASDKPMRLLTHTHMPPHTKDM